MSDAFDYGGYARGARVPSIPNVLITDAELTEEELAISREYRRRERLRISRPYGRRVKIDAKAEKWLDKREQDRRNRILHWSGLTRLMTLVEPDFIFEGFSAVKRIITLPILFSAVLQDCDWNMPKDLFPTILAYFGTNPWNTRPSVTKCRMMTNVSSEISMISIYGPICGKDLELVLKVSHGMNLGEDDTSWVWKCVSCCVNYW